MNKESYPPEVIQDLKNYYREQFTSNLETLNKRSWNNGKLLGILNKQQANEVIKRDKRITICTSLKYNVYFITDDSLIIHPLLERDFDFFSCIMGMPNKLGGGFKVNETAEDIITGTKVDLYLETLDDLVNFLAEPKVYFPKGIEPIVR